MERLCRRRQRDRPHAAIEELDTQIGFEPANLMTERSRRDVQLQRRFPQAEMPGCGLERLERIQRGRSFMHENFSPVSGDNILCKAASPRPSYANRHAYLEDSSSWAMVNEEVGPMASTTYNGVLSLYGDRAASVAEAIGGGLRKLGRRVS